MWQDFATIMMHPDTIQQLRDFRNELHMLFGKRADALFELCDAAVTAGLSPSLVYLSLEAVHRRGWGSLYAALAEGEIDVEQVRSLLSVLDWDLYRRYHVLTLDVVSHRTSQ